MNNTIKTIVLFSILTLIMIFVGKTFGGQNGLSIAFFLAITINFFSYFFSDKIALWSAGAKPLDPNKYSFISYTVKEITERAKMPMPRLFIAPSLQPNAFATGRSPDHSAIAVTQGLINNLTKNEIKGVLAHEIAHIKNRDILIATVVAVMASVITTMINSFRFFSIFSSNGTGNDSSKNNIVTEIFIMLLAPLAAILIQLAVSRSREFKADEVGAKLAGEPEGLANALNKIDYLAKNVNLKERVNPAFENLYIINPLNGSSVGGFVEKMFSTHPPTKERIEKLMNIGK